jgi:hypothetical protein
MGEDKGMKRIVRTNNNPRKPPTAILYDRCRFPVNIGTAGRKRSPAMQVNTSGNFGGWILLNSYPPSVFEPLNETIAVMMGHA